MTKQDSPYLHTPNRLADVIAAIQAMATYNEYKLTHAEWADRISADKEKSEYWKTVFEEHPEFFRLDTTREKASLVWRRQYQRRFDPNGGRVLTNDEYYGLSAKERQGFSRMPLAPADIKTLIDTAINLHSRAIAMRSEGRWWLPVLSSGAAALIGGMVGVLLKN